MIARVKVLVLYWQPLVGEGLTRLLGQDPRLDVLSAFQGEEAAAEHALGEDPAVIVLEEGGPIGLLDLIHRPTCHRVINVSAITSECWTLQVDRVRTDADMLTRSLVEACLDGNSRDGRPQTSAVPGGG
ncbi:MAG: hypothetical protein ACC726_15860 [Chloroflexota bacterium]